MSKTDLQLRRYKQSKIARKIRVSGIKVNRSKSDLDPDLAVTVHRRSTEAEVHRGRLAGAGGGGRSSGERPGPEERTTWRRRGGAGSPRRRGARPASSRRGGGGSSRARWRRRPACGGAKERQRREARGGAGRRRGPRGPATGLPGLAAGMWSGATWRRGSGGGEMSGRVGRVRLGAEMFFFF